MNNATMKTNRMPEGNGQNTNENRSENGIFIKCRKANKEAENQIYIEPGGFLSGKVDWIFHDNNF